MGAQKIYLEESRNKVTSLSNESTDTQYPSAKCMYDAMMLANQALQSKENVSAKVTSITSSSTDTQYPSAKCVYDSVGTKISEPASEGTNGQVLTTNGNGGRSWTNVDALPSQTGKSGKYLTTNGTTASWADVEAGPTVVQTTGQSTTDVMSQKAVTDAIPNVTGKEDTSNKVTSISSTSTDTQYPSAKAVYDSITTGNGIFKLKGTIVPLVPAPYNSIQEYIVANGDTSSTNIDYVSYNNFRLYSGDYSTSYLYFTPSTGTVHIKLKTYCRHSYSGTPWASYYDNGVQQQIRLGPSNSYLTMDFTQTTGAVSLPGASVIYGNIDYIVEEFTVDDMPQLPVSHPLTEPHVIGDTYRVASAGTIASKAAAVNDLVVCIATGSAPNDNDWIVIPNGSLSTKISEPSTEGTNGQVLTTDGNGGRSWTTVGGGSSDKMDKANPTGTGNMAINGTVASGSVNSTAIGSNVTVDADNSVGIGEQLLVSSDNQTVLGKYNVEDSTGTHRLVVGNGTGAAARANALAINAATGDLRIKGNLYIGCNDDSTGGSTVGGEHLYQHNLYIYDALSGNRLYFTTIVLTTTVEQFNRTSFIAYLNNNGFTSESACYAVSGGYCYFTTSDTIAIGIGLYGTNTGFGVVALRTTVNEVPQYQRFSESAMGLTDIVVQIS